MPSLVLVCSKQYKVRTVFCILSHSVRTGFIVSDVSGRNQKLLNHFRLVPRPRISGVLPLFPLYALRRVQPTLFLLGAFEKLRKSDYKLHCV